MIRRASAAPRRVDFRKLLFSGLVFAGWCLFPGSAKAQTGVHPLARPEFDRGRVAEDARLERMVLVLQPDAAQEQKLEDLLAAQQDSTSPLYHQWLTPEEFGRQFGISDNDLDQVVRWLQDQGFEVEPAPDNHRQLVFSGTAGQVETAFRTEMHRYRVNGEIHQANASNIAIPAALASVIGGVLSLHDFRSKPMHAEYTASSTVHYLAPGDFATIYNLTPLYGSSTNGAGQSIAIVARSNLVMSDVDGFRAKYGVPASDPTVIVNGKDPGVLSSGEQGEVELDAEWSGAVAPNASIQVVVSASTQTTDGVELSAQYIVNHNLAPIVSMSFGSCESGMSRTESQFWNQLWQQAAAQGMSVFVASGDAGAAGCDDPSSSTGSTAGVNGLCSSPYSTCVGGTEFSDTSNPAAYWYSTNTTTRASAQSYIPEAAWNESGTAGGSALWATGGGPSFVYTKPSWQSSPGVPADGHRDVPDVALAAAAHDGYLFYENGSLYAGSGTSLATPTFAAIMALIDGRLGARQGNANPSLYALATGQAHGGPAAFHDITSGNNSVPGVTGFNAGTGYDLVTGLGSVDANVLLNAWPGGSAPPPKCTFSLGASSASIDATAQTVSVAVTASSSGCSWTVSNTAGWMSGAASGIGSQTLTLSVSANPSSIARTASLTIAGLPFAVSQAGAPCTYTLSAPPLRSSASGFAGEIFVSAAAGCSWTAVSQAPWIVITSAPAGTGSGAVTFVAAPNTSGTRHGTLVVAGQTVTVTEAPRGRLGIARPSVPNPSGPQTIAQ